MATHGDIARREAWRRQQGRTGRADMAQARRRVGNALLPRENPPGKNGYNVGYYFHARWS
jgi:hypothetical protein